jgi:hypothetical protein
MTSSLVVVLRKEMTRISSSVSVCTVEPATPPKKPRGHKSLLLVPEAVVFIGEGWALKYLLGVHEVEAVVLWIGLALLFVPGEVHRRSVYT